LGNGFARLLGNTGPESGSNARNDDSPVRVIHSTQSIPASTIPTVGRRRSISQRSLDEVGARVYGSAHAVGMDWQGGNNTPYNDGHNTGGG